MEVVRMMALLSVCILGFFLGMRHATDADHVIAISTIVSRERRIWAAAVIGSLWGLGHALTLLLVGGTIVLFGLVIPPRVGLTMELSVAVMLILLGILNLTGFLRWASEAFTPSEARAGRVHRHAHSHGEHVHDHLHAHAHAEHGHGHVPGSHEHAEAQTPLPRLDRTFGGLRVYHLLRPLLVGVVHGLAGSAALALLVLATIREPLWGIAYLLVFGAGTIAGMMLITAAIALPFAYAADRSRRFHRVLGIASGALSLGFGLFLAYQIGFVDGLFTTSPQWSPH